MKNKNRKEERRKLINRIVEIILIIIIVLLLLHNCSLTKEKGKKQSGKVNIIDITCDSDKCQHPDNDNIIVDCLKDEQNGRCLVPNFIGKTKNDVLKWLSLISNTIEIEIKTVEDTNYKDGTVLEQSIYNVSVKNLLTEKTKLVITIVNNGSLVDCQKNSQSSKCVLPNFVGKTKNNVVSWADGVVNNIKIKYVYIESSKKVGTIINQSVKSGTSIKDILDKGETIIIYISNGGKKNSSTNSSNNQGSNGNTNKNTPDKPTPEPASLDDDFYVNDKKTAKWQNETDLKIFENSMYKVPGKIAPESTNTYKFVVNNGTNNTLKYKISFTETNQDNINMKYRLKKGDTYLVDHFVSYDQLNIDSMILNTQSSDTYYLEWKWVGDNDRNDTQIGKKAQSSSVKYDLIINVEAESI